MKPSPDIIVVGAGPAGLMAAVAAASRGAGVVVLEKTARPGAKLLVTGGGRCNLTNTAPRDEFMAAFGRQGRFMSHALDAMDSPGLRQFFAELGVETACPDGFEVYPASNRATDVLDALVARCERLGVDIRAGQSVGRVLLDVSGERRIVTGVKTSSSKAPAGRVILCCGGLARAELGASGAGYDMAKLCGHAIIPPVEALVGLVCRWGPMDRLAGVSVPKARVWIDLPKAAKAGRTGPVLFTHAGVSGPAVLNISGEVSALLADRKEVPLRIDLAPDEPAETWTGRLDEWGHRQGAAPVRALLAGLMPRALAEMICRVAMMSPDTPMAEVNRDRRGRTVAAVKSLPLTVTGTEGFDSAMVTRGGVKLKEVDPRTMASRRTDGLYFAGEILDLDGPCGGYNLQWAFSSGHLAGLSAATCSTGNDQ